MKFKVEGQVEITLRVIKAKGGKVILEIDGDRHYLSVDRKVVIEAPFKYSQLEPA